MKVCGASLKVVFRSRRGTCQLTKNADRAAKFKLIGEAITAQAWKDRNMEHTYQMSRGLSQDPKLSRVPGGPVFKTPQWVRTSKVSA